MPRTNHPHKHRILYPGLIILVCLLLGGILGLFIGCARTPNNLNIEPPQASIVYDAKGREISRFFEQNRESLPLHQVPQTVIDAVISVEDARFYNHRGIDLRAIARAVWADIRGGGYRQGASTITQQLARNAFLNQRRELMRKIREAIYAVKIERQFSKDQILEAYLNTIYMGHGAYGIESAAKTYFSKSVKELSLSETAMITAIIRSPGFYDPYLHPDRARERRGVVLDQMVKYGKLSEARAQAAKAKPLGVTVLKPRQRRAAYFMEYIQRQLGKTGIQPEELDRNGLRIYTTLDRDIQQAAEDMVAQAPVGKPDAKGILQPELAVVAIDPSNGYIKAMVGGRDFGNTQLNRADMAKRQPGSAIKPFVYTAAIDSRLYNPSQIVQDEPKSFGSYAPHNYNNKYYGAIPLEEALQHSSNVIACELVYNLGPSKVVSYARKMGLQNLVLSGKKNDLNLAALGLGGLTDGITPMELASAYIPLANRGIRSEPFGILKVTDQLGTILYEQRPRTRAVLDEATAFIMTSMLRRVVNAGTGAAAYIDDYHPVAGKTGTTTDNTNAWFVGYTPNLVASVWIGNDSQNQSLPFGSKQAAVLWRIFMSKAVQYLPQADFMPAAGVSGPLTICKVSGGVATDNCPADRLDSAYFLDGTVPGPCSLHSSGGSSSPAPTAAQPDQPTGSTGNNANVEVKVTVKICLDSDALANAYCPADRAISRAYTRGEEPTQYCEVHGPWTKESVMD